MNDIPNDLIKEIVQYIENEINITELYENSEEFDNLLEEFFNETEYLFSIDNLEAAGAYRWGKIMVFDYYIDQVIDKVEKSVKKFFKNKFDIYIETNRETLFGISILSHLESVFSLIDIDENIVECENGCEINECFECGSEIKISKVFIDNFSRKGFKRIFSDEERSPAGLFQLLEDKYCENMYKN